MHVCDPTGLVTVTPGRVLREFPPESQRQFLEGKLARE